MKQILYISFFLFSVLSFGQQRKINGIVKDSIGEVIPGAAIIIEGTTRGTNTDFEGKYSINVNPNEFLIFSFLGKKEQRISADKNEINVQLNDSGVKIIDIIPYVKTVNFRNSYRMAIGRSPRYNFKFNSKREKFIIYIIKKTAPNRLDIEFQKKYNVTYTNTFSNLNIKYLKRHNHLTFKHLKKKYKKAWQTEIRNDAIGLDDF